MTSHGPAAGLLSFDKPRNNLLAAIGEYASWGYFDFRAKTYRPSGDSMSFTTATILLALSDARKAGLSIPAVTLRKALLLLKRCLS